MTTPKRRYGLNAERVREIDALQKEKPQKLIVERWERSYMGAATDARIKISLPLLEFQTGIETARSARSRARTAILRSR